MRVSKTEKSQQKTNTVIGFENTIQVSKGSNSFTLGSGESEKAGKCFIFSWALRFM